MPTTQWWKLLKNRKASWIRLKNLTCEEARLAKEQGKTDASARRSYDTVTDWKKKRAALTKQKRQVSATLTQARKDSQRALAQHIDDMRKKEQKNFNDTHSLHIANNMKLQAQIRKCDGIIKAGNERLRSKLKHLDKSNSSCKGTKKCTFTKNKKATKGW